MLPLQHLLSGGNFVYYAYATNIMQAAWKVYFTSSYSRTYLPAGID
jgi:hypothetical protein